MAEIFKKLNSMGFSEENMPEQKQKQGKEYKIKVK